MNKALQAWYRGNEDARLNRGNHAHEYRGHAKKCYRSGYQEGQLDRKAIKEKP